MDTDTRTCEGNSVLALPDPQFGYTYVGCPGCEDCDQVAIRARQTPSGDPFARLPQVEEVPW
jgi:hypothetical protein